MPEWWPMAAGTVSGLGALIAIAVVVWKIGRWTERVDAGTKATGKLEDKLEQFAGEIRSRIDQIFLRLPPPQPVASSSPAKLTDFGRKIAAKFGAQEWATELAPTVVEEVKGKRGFEIDEFSDNYVTSKLDESINDRVAACAYDFGIKRDGVLVVLRVVLRNELIRLTEAE